MAGITLAQAEAKLTAAMDAYDAALTAQEYKNPGSGGASVRRADLKALQDAVTYWDGVVKRLTGGGIGIIGATPL